MGETTLDARGLRCPLPALMMEKRLAGLTSRDTLIVLATDPMAKIDIPLYCTQNAHGCEMSQENGVLRFAITKSGP